MILYNIINRKQNNSFLSVISRGEIKNSNDNTCKHQSSRITNYKLLIASNVWGTINLAPR